MKTAARNPKTIAAEFVAAARKAGWIVTVKESIVTISKHFAANDRAAFVACDSEYYGILTMVPARGGSIWGTDGGSVGGYSAMLHGFFTMHQSGVGKRVAAAIAAELRRK